MGRVVGRARWVGRQVRDTGRSVRAVGWVATAADRVGTLVARSPQRRAADERRASEHAALRNELADVRGHLRLVDSRFDDTDIRQAEIRDHLERMSADGERRLRDELDARLLDIRHLQQQIEDLRSHAHDDRADVQRLRLATDSVHHMVVDWLWAANAPLADQPLISVVMATAFAERIGYLRSAIESVISQTYQRWELLVVDDGDPAFLSPLPDWWRVDPRITVLRGEAQGAGSARNVGLAAAAGDIVAYLDDDCRWFPWWLHAVARAFSAEPDVGVVHGVRVIEADRERPNAWTYAEALDPLTLHTGNPVDTNVLAHRAHLLADGWPTISSCADYDVVVRLFPSGGRYIPVPAATYATTSPSRAWAPERAAINAANFTTVQQRARKARPLRVVAHNGLYPLLSETYIGDELAALQRRDIDVVLSRVAPASVAVPSRIDAPLYDSLDEAIAAHDPDVVLSHWAGIGLAMRDEASRSGVPHAIRLHSFDGGHAMRDLIDAWCVGIWDFSHLAGRHHLQFGLDTLIAAPPSFDSGPRDGSVMSLSAGLPKKDFPTLLRALDLVPEASLDIVTATTNGYETLPATIRALTKELQLDDRVSVEENVDYSVAQSRLRHAGVLVYSIAADQHVGQPRSVIEAGLVGTPLVVPDCASMDHLVGDTAHRYIRGNASSLAAAITDAREKPRSIDERQALSDRLRDAHGSERVATEWANSLTAAVTAWQRRRRTDREGINLRWWWHN